MIVEIADIKNCAQAMEAAGLQGNAMLSLCEEALLTDQDAVQIMMMDSLVGSILITEDDIKDALEDANISPSRGNVRVIVENIDTDILESKDSVKEYLSEVISTSISELDLDVPY